jgi:cyclopropane fatty-acyl-phospholipid synthase-like methyltransferase
LPRWAKLQWWLRYLVRHVGQFNPRSRSKDNVARHYDLDGRLYSLFLDADKQYSCAYFETPDATLDDAQLAKKRHLAAKLLIGPGHRVLDIGSGWGGLGLYLAEMTGASVTGVTLSTEQLQVSNERAAQKNLSRSAKFFLEDYRDVAGPFDRIVSVGMFEHVGVDFYERYFRRCAELLTDDGVMMLHSIGRSDGPDVTNPWIAKYIFPGGYIPALSEVIPAIERAGLLVCDIEVLRLHYAETLKAWRERFMARDEFPDPVRQTPGRGADDPRLHHARRSQTSRDRAQPAAAAADCGRIDRNPPGMLVSQAETRTEMGVGRYRPGQLRAQRNQHRRIAGHAALFRTSNLFHGVDQHRQPPSFATGRAPRRRSPRFRSPRLKLLAHCLSLPKPCRRQSGTSQPVSDDHAVKKMPRM